MKHPEELQCLSHEEIESVKQDMNTTAKSITKNELVSVKSMILPPTFTFNVLKLVQVLINPKSSNSELEWTTIKKQMLISS